MEHDTRKLNSFIAAIEQCPDNLPYHIMLNHWMDESGETLKDPEEFKYFVRLIPMIQKREKIRRAEKEKENAKKQQTV